MKMGIPGLGIVGAILITISAIGLFGAWITGCTRIPFVVGLDNYLPSALGKVHPKYGTPHVSLLVHGVLISLFLIFSIFGSTIKEAFLVLIDMSIILFFIPFLYMFASLIIHRKRNTGGNGNPSTFLKSNLTGWWVILSGLMVTLFTVIISIVPTKDVENKELFILKVVGGAVLLTSVGLAFYHSKRKSKDIN